MCTWEIFVGIFFTFSKKIYLEYKSLGISIWDCIKVWEIIGMF